MNKLLTLIALFAFMSPSAYALDYYWVGTSNGSGNYSNLNSWRIGSRTGSVPFQPPISTDNVFFESAAFASSAATITISQSVNCANMVWDANLANMVTVVSSGTGISLDIYGSFILAQPSSLNFNFRENIRLRSTTNGVVPINLRGQMLKLATLVIGDTGSGSAIFDLQSDLLVDDPAQTNHSGNAWGYINFINGHLRTNGFKIRADYFASSSGARGRTLDIQNSIIELHGSYPYAWHWYVDFNSSVPLSSAARNYTALLAQGSHIQFKSYAGIQWNKQAYFGIGQRYDLMTSDVPVNFFGNNAVTTTSTLFSALPAPDTFNIITLNTSCNFYQTCNLLTEDLYVRGNQNYVFASNYMSAITAENIYPMSNCGEFVTFEVSNNGNATRGMLRKKSPNSSLDLNNVVLVDVECDLAGGRVYNANNSLRRGYAPLSPVAFNWNLTSPVGKDYYFIARNAYAFGSNNYFTWSDPNNWNVWNGSAWVPNLSGCLPSIADNVYFGSASFPSYVAGTTSPVAASNLGLVAIDTVAACHNIHWLNDMKNQSSMIFPAARDVINYKLSVYGSAYYNRKMRQVSTGSIDYLGAVTDTISPDSSYFWNTNTLKQYAYYDIVGDNSMSSTDWRVNTLTAEQRSFMRTNAIQLQLVNFRPHSRDMDSTWVQFVAHNANFSDQSGNVSYTGNTTFELLGSWSANPTTTVNIDAGRVPNLIARCNANFGNNRFSNFFPSPAPFTSRKCEIQGNAHFYENGWFYNYAHNSDYARIHVSGTMALYDGDMTLSAGKTYEIGANDSVMIRIDGKLFSIGNCQNMVKLKNVASFPTRFSVGNTAASVVNYTYISDMNNIGSTLNCINSIDGGNNTNITFSASATPQTYYWRAKNGTMANHTSHFTGNWNDPRHWAMNPSSLVGDNGCIPTTLDSVIFDNMSSLGGLGNDSVIINDISFCKTAWFKSNKRSSSNANGAGKLYIAQSLIIDNPMPNHNYTGALYFIDDSIANIKTSGTPLRNNYIYFSNSTGRWNLLDNLSTSNPLGSGISNYGSIYLLAGTLNTNNHTVNINGLLSTFISNQPRTFNLGSSTINVAGRQVESGNYAIYFASYANTVINAGTSSINLINNGNTVPRTIFVGTVPGRRFYNFTINDTIYPSTLQGSAAFNYMRMIGETRVMNNNSYDSLYLEGGYFYRFDQSTTQTLVAPHGKILANGSPGKFINIETTQSAVAVANRSRFYKDHGAAFCLDFVKIKENHAAKQSNLALVPAAWQPIHNSLIFQTGVNSDNINGTATGIWTFNLPIPTNPTVTGSTTFNLCAPDSSLTVPISLLGNSPYVFNSTWSNAIGQSGVQRDTIYDNDNNPNTPFVFNFPIANGLYNATYNLSLYTIRCGENAPASPATIQVFVTPPNVLVSQNRQKSCTLNNNRAWVTFFDDTENKPIASIQDKVNAADVSPLGSTLVEVFFNPSVQNLPSTSLCAPNYPYLQRYWHISPQNNTAANVRLYFTQTELNNLAAQTYAGNYGQALNPATDIVVLKYSSGTVGVGPCVVVPHSVLGWNSSSNRPFTSTVGVIGVEFAVSSFSAFVIVPTPSALLALKLNDFEANLLDNRSVDLVWHTENEENMSHFVVEKSLDGAAFYPIGETSARNLGSLQEYHLLDRQPAVGSNYYRLKMYNSDQTFAYSAVKEISLSGANLVELYPNPSQDQINLRLESINASEAQIFIIDQLGRQAWSQSVSLQNGLNSFNFDISALAAGIYQLKLQDNFGNIRQLRFVVE